jgi:UDPglucose 6-dehydrogenase
MSDWTDAPRSADPRNLAVIGAGYVGLSTAAGLGFAGHHVVVGEHDSHRLAELQAGRIPFYEPGLDELVSEARRLGRLEFTGDNAAAASNVDAVFLAVPTPQGPRGGVDLSKLEAAIDAIAPVVSAPTAVAVKSSVPPGSSRPLIEHLRKAGSDAPLVINPEFLQEGRAVEGVLHPSRIVVGSHDHQARRLVAALHEQFGSPVIETDPESAALTKYAANSYLATRLTFVNAIAHLAESFAADVAAVLEGMALDPRIGPDYLQPGPGFGGSCFPKDLQALVVAAEAHGQDLKLVKAVIETNDGQLDRIVLKTGEAAGGLEGRVIALLGLAFKAGTEDSRGSPAVSLARRLVEAGARVRAYDPAARVELDGVEICPDALTAAAGADAVLVATDWPEFAEIDPRRLAATMRGSAIVDARNLLDKNAVVAAGLTYRGLGR